jgi:predicted glycoside hydrolase/deacetylase ChbG (UPF0249 family)
MASTLLALIITADDLGYCTQRDDGIFNIVQRTNATMVSSASLLVNGQSAVTAVQRAHQLNLHLALHLNLTEGCPVAHHASSLTQPMPDGTHQMLGKQGFRDAVANGTVQMRDIEIEAEAQLMRFRDLVGHVATHFDGHQHVHTINAVAAVLAPLMHRYGVRTTRITDTELDIERAWLTFNDCSQSPTTTTTKIAGNVEFLQQVSREAAQARAIYQLHHIESTTYFIGLTTMGTNATTSRLQYLLATLESKQQQPDGTSRSSAALASCEWMVHPGNQADRGIGDEFNQSPDRLYEQHFLLSQETRHVIQRYCSTCSWPRISAHTCSSVGESERE